MLDRRAEAAVGPVAPPALEPVEHDALSVREHFELGGGFSYVGGGPPFAAAGGFGAQAQQLGERGLGRERGKSRCTALAAQGIYPVHGCREYGPRGAPISYAEHFEE